MIKAKDHKNDFMKRAKDLLHRQKEAALLSGKRTGLGDAEKIKKTKDKVIHE